VGGWWLVLIFILCDQREDGNLVILLNYMDWSYYFCACGQAGNGRGDGVGSDSLSIGMV
jgi:hypothetical protein